VPSNTVISAFSEEHVERLTGLTKKQLRYWDRTGFFVPTHASEDRKDAYSRIYSFKDIVSLRTIGILRLQHGVPLQHLRKVAEKLNHLADDKWTKTTLYVLNKKVVFDDPENGGQREVVSGQYVLGIALKTIIEDTQKDVAKMQRREERKVGHIERSKYVSHNAWVISGTRIPTAAILRFKNAGYSVDQIIEEYPDLTPEDIKVAIAHEENKSEAA